MSRKLKKAKVIEDKEELGVLETLPDSELTSGYQINELNFERTDPLFLFFDELYNPNGNHIFALPTVIPISTLARDSSYNFTKEFKNELMQYLNISVKKDIKCFREKYPKLQDRLPPLPSGGLIQHITVSVHPEKKYAIFKTDNMLMRIDQEGSDKFRKLTKLELAPQTFPRDKLKSFYLHPDNKEIGVPYVIMNNKDVTQNPYNYLAFRSIVYLFNNLGIKKYRERSNRSL